MNDDNLQDLLIASRAAVDRMRDVLNALDRNGWPLFAHSLYLPMIQLERAYTRVSGATNPQSPSPAHRTPEAPPHDVLSRRLHVGVVTLSEPDRPARRLLRRLRAHQRSAQALEVESQPLQATR